MSMHNEINSRAYVAISAESKDYLRSSSGSVFPVMARRFWEDGGYVCAAVFQGGRVYHVVSNDSDDLQAMQGSKYVESSMKSALPEALDVLGKGCPLLFVGTPCQVAAIKRASNNPDNLITVDLLCHGVAPAKVLNRYLELRGYKSTAISDMTFRSKNPFEKSNYDICLRINDKVVHFPERKDIFAFAYARSLVLSNRCYSCRFACLERQGDITIGDCATYRDNCDLVYGKCLSTILVNSDRGMALWNDLKSSFRYRNLDVEKEHSLNKALKGPCQKPPMREAFQNDYYTLCLDELSNKYLAPRAETELIFIAKHIIPAALRDFLITWKRHGLRK